MLRLHEIKLALDHDEAALRAGRPDQAGRGRRELIEYRICRQAVDARKKGAIHLVYSVDATVRNEERLLRRRNKRRHDHGARHRFIRPATPGAGKACGSRPVVVGSGPAGLFAALLLARQGYRPLVLERGRPVDERYRDVERFWSTGQLAADSNLHFGEGGAGTFSDGKLTTLIHDPRCRKVLEEFVAAGAADEILYLNKPHLGSDRLPAIVRGSARTISRWAARCASTVPRRRPARQGQEDGRRGGGRPGASWKRPVVVLAPGNSARDTFAMLLAARRDAAGQAVFPRRCASSIRSA